MDSDKDIHIDALIFLMDKRDAEIKKLKAQIQQYKEFISQIGKNAENFRFFS